MQTTNILDLNNRIDALEKKQDQDTTDYEKLSNLPKVNSVELKGNKTTSDLGINATNVMMSDGVTSVEDALDSLIVVNQDVTNIDITIAWGNIYRSDFIMINLTELGLSATPYIVGATYYTTNNNDGWLRVHGVTSTYIECNILRPTSVEGASGKISMLLKKA